MNDPLLSRTGQTCPWGKCTEAHIDVPLPEVIHDEVVMVAGLSGKNKTEWVRDLIIRALRGDVEFARLRYEGRDKNRENSG